MEAIEKLAAERFARARALARRGIEARFLECALAVRRARRAPERAHHARAFVRQLEAPLRTARCNRAERGCNALRRARRIGHLALIRLLRAHPLRSLVLEIAHRARQEHRIENPAR